MDGRHFDALARHLSSRRTAIGGLLAGLILALETSARGNDKRRKQKGRSNRKDRGKNRDKGKGKSKNRAKAQADACWRSAACIPGKNTNVSRCDLSRYTTFPSRDSTGSNLSRSNLRGVNASGVNFTRANLSGACLVDADFTGATFANSTNLGNAVFCNTRMPNGTIDDSGCTAGTSCCTTPCISDAQCNDGQICCSGTCLTSNDYGLETTFGEFGTDLDQFNLAGAVAVAPNGLTAWVGDLNNGRVSVWTRPTPTSIDWEYRAPIGSNGREENQFGDPRSLAISPDTLTLWVADRANDRIAVWKRNDATSLAWALHSLIGLGEINNPTAVAVTPDGLTVWATEAEAGRITVWRRETADSTEWSLHSSFGSPGRGANQFDFPSGVAVSPDGLIVWVGDANNRRVSIWRRDDSNTTEWEPWTTIGDGGSGPDDINLPMGVTISPDTLKIWVCDSANDRISVWTRTGANTTDWTFQTTFGEGRMPWPTQVAVTPDGQTLLAADLRNHSISVWSVACPG